MLAARLAVLACMLAVAPAASGAPSSVWYQYVVTGRTTETTTDKNERAGSPTETTTDVRVVEWVARSSTARALSRKGADLPLASPLAGAVTAFREDQRYEGYYLAADPADPSKQVKQPCTRTAAGRGSAGPRFRAPLGGTARGFFVAIGSKPTVAVHYVRNDACSATPGGAKESNGSVRVELLPATEPQQRFLRIPAGRIAFGKTFSSGVLTLRNELPPTVGGGQTLTVARKWEVRLYLYRCPGTKPCPADAVPAAASARLP